MWYTTRNLLRIRGVQPETPYSARVKDDSRLGLEIARVWFRSSCRKRPHVDCQSYRLGIDSRWVPL